MRNADNFTRIKVTISPHLKSSTFCSYFFSHSPYICCVGIDRVTLNINKFLNKFLKIYSLNYSYNIYKYNMILIFKNFIAYVFSHLENVLEKMKEKNNEEEPNPN